MTDDEIKERFGIKVFEPYSGSFFSDVIYESRADGWYIYSAVRWAFGEPHFMYTMKVAAPIIFEKYA